MKRHETEIAAMRKFAPQTPCRRNRSFAIVIYLHLGDWTPADLRMVMMRDTPDYKVNNTLSVQ